MTGYQNYARTSIETSDPRQVVVLLYEGAIKFLNQALEAIEQNDRKSMSTFIKKTQAIIHYLTNSLDHENGAEVAANLDRLYAYMRDILARANIKCEPAPIREAIELIKPLLEAWREIAHDPEAAAALQNRKAAPAPLPATEPAEPLESVDSGAPANIDSVRVATADTTAPRPARRPAPQSATAAVAGRAAYGIH